MYHFILGQYRTIPALRLKHRPGSEWFWQTDKYGTPAHKPIVEPWKVIAEPAGFLIAPRGWERVSDVSNVVFTNGAIADDDGKVYIYYAASDTRLHVASTTIGHFWLCIQKNRRPLVCLCPAITARCPQSCGTCTKCNAQKLCVNLKMIPRYDSVIL